MMQIVRNRFLWIGGGLSALYLLLAVVVPAIVMGELANAIRMTVAVGVLLGYAPLAFEALKRDRPSNIHYLVLGICTNWLSILLLGAWGVLGRIAGFSTQLQTSWLTGFLVFVAFLGGVLHLYAPGMIDGRIPVRRHWLLLISVGAGGVIAGLILGTFWLQGL